MKTNTVKGFKDFLGNEARKRAKIKRIIEDKFNSFGFEPAETPIIELEEFVRGKNQNDEAVRDIYSLEDRAKRKLALRYEYTFQLQRISKEQKLPYKRYQIGPNFRDEPIKKGRLRQFIQCDADTIGSTIQDEAELLVLAKQIFDDLKIDITIYVNNRKLLNEILVTEGIKEKDQEQVIRELDKMDKLSKEEVAKNLKPLGAEKLLKLFKEGEKYFEKYKYYQEIKALKKACKDYEIEVKFNPTLARGLSYYNGTVFEFWSKDINVSLGGGGSYLVNQVQASGFALGLEPIFLISPIEEDKLNYAIISLNQDKKSIETANKLRKDGNSVQLITNKTINKALEYANSKEIEKVIVIGDKESKEGKYKVKDMKSGKEKELKV